MNANEFLLHLLTGAERIGIEVPAPGERRKAVFPTLIRDDSDRHILIQEHCAGQIQPRICMKTNGGGWVERRGTALALYTVLPDCRSPLIAWDIDAAGLGHSTQQTADQADHVAARIHKILGEYGIPTTVVASGGGYGRHVLLVPEDPVPAGFAVWFADLVRGAVLRSIDNAEIEIRPNSITNFGALLTLPAQGRPRGVGGGSLVTPAAWDAVLIAPRACLESWISDKWHLVQAQRERRQAAEVVYRDSQRACSEGGVQSADIDLVIVAERLGTITGTQGHDLMLTCPTHGGNHALKVNIAKRMWRCFRCDVGGAGDAAAYTLVRFLLGDPTPREVFAALRSLEHLHARS